MSEKKFKRIATVCALSILFGAFLHGKFDSSFLDFIFLFAAAAGTAGFIYAGYKKDEAMEILQEDISHGADRIFERNRELVEEIMQKSAELSEAREEAKRLHTEVEIHGDQRDHNKCYMNDFRLYQACKITKNPLPDPQKITLPEMLWGCAAYCPGQYRAVSEKEKQMLEEIKEVIKKYMY